MRVSKLLIFSLFSLACFLLAVDGKRIPGAPLPEREPAENPEKLVGKLSMNMEDQAVIEIWDGTIFNLVGPTRRDVSTLVTDAGLMGYLLFEGYRRGTAFEVVSWDTFSNGDPLGESVYRPPVIEGEHTALVVRVIVNGLEPEATQDQIRSEIFNSDGKDQWNINLFEKCSHGSYKIVPFTGQYAGLFDTSGGVLDLQLGEVSMNFNLELCGDCEAYEWMGHVASTKFPYDDSVDFILFVLPDGLVDWGSTRAYAYRPGRFSVYDDSAVLNPFVLGHEIGHNLGLRHSADVADSIGEYGDHTCLMGNGYVDNDIQRDFDENTHCFNSAKNWQLGWFADRRAQWSPSDGLKTFDLVGLGDYEFTNGEQIITLEIESDGVKCYLSFNRITGVSQDVKEYQDLVTLQCVHDQMSYLVAHLDSGDWAADINVSIEREDKSDVVFNLDYVVYVEGIEIKPKGQASIARIILGSETEVRNDNEANSRSVNCIVDATKSASSCTEQCGSVSGVPKNDYFALRGGSCADYECSMYDGLCVVGGKCIEEVFVPLLTELGSLTTNDTDYFCEEILQYPEDLLSNATCFLTPSTFCSHNFCELLISDYHPFCTHNFSSRAQIDDVEKQITLTLAYSIRMLDEMLTQFSSTTIAQNIADLLGEDSVDVNIDMVSHTIEVTFVTKHHVDLEDRVTHKWFLDRLREKLEYDHIFVDLDKLEYTESNVEEDENLVDKLWANKLVFICAVTGVLLLILLLFSIICICCKCDDSPSYKNRAYVGNV